MTEKIANTMTSLAEENRDVKISLRLLLKYEIQSLLERLYALGDDSLLILTNTSEGTCSHLGTSNADNFLQSLQTNCGVNLKDTFQKFCSNCGGTSQHMAMSNLPGSSSFTGSQSQCQNEANIQPLLQTASLSNFQSQLNSLNSMINSPHQVKQDFNTRFTPYPTPGAGAHSKQFNTMNMTVMKPAEITTPLHPPVMERKKRNACRHFLSKGYCWQGSTCAFLHTRDQRILDAVGITLTSNADQSNQSPSNQSPSNQSPSSTEEKELHDDSK